MSDHLHVCEVRWLDHSGPTVVVHFAPLPLQVPSAHNTPQFSPLSPFPPSCQSKVVQTYVVRRAPSPVQFVTFEILSNHGRPDFTCIYRLRVHGSVANP
jgi:hypothetical protein